MCKMDAIASYYYVKRFYEIFGERFYDHCLMLHDILEIINHDNLDLFIEGLHNKWAVCAYDLLEASLILPSHKICNYLINNYEYNGITGGIIKEYDDTKMRYLIIAQTNIASIKILIKKINNINIEMAMVLVRALSEKTSGLLINVPHSCYVIKKIIKLLPNVEYSTFFGTVLMKALPNIYVEDVLLQLSLVKKIMEIPCSESTICTAFNVVTINDNWEYFIMGLFVNKHKCNMLSDDHIKKSYNKHYDKYYKMCFNIFAITNQLLDDDIKLIIKYRMLGIFF